MTVTRVLPMWVLDLSPLQSFGLAVVVGLLKVHDFERGLADTVSLS